MTVYLYHVLQVLSHCDQESRLINQDPDVQYPLLHGEDRGWSGFFHLVLQASRVTGHGNDRPQLSGYIFVSNIDELNPHCNSVALYVRSVRYGWIFFLFHHPPHWYSGTFGCW